MRFSTVVDALTGNKVKKNRSGNQGSFGGQQNGLPLNANDRYMAMNGANTAVQSSGYRPANSNYVARMPAHVQTSPQPQMPSNNSQFQNRDFTNQANYRPPPPSRPSRARSIDSSQRHHRHCHGSLESPYPAVSYKDSAKLEGSADNV
jgi:hypothetical protein